MRVRSVRLGVIITTGAVVALLGCNDRAEVDRRYQEIDRYRAIINRAKQDPADVLALRELVEFSDRSNDWDRSQMFAQMRDLGQVFQETPKARKEFEEILLPVIKKGLGDRSGSVRREAALAAGAFGPLSKPAMPELVQAMRNYPNEDTALFSVKALGEIGPDAREAIPDIEEVRKIWRESERSINRALRKIRGEPD